MPVMLCDVLSVDVNWPDWRYSLSADEPAQGVLVPSNDIPLGKLSIPDVSSDVLIVDENCPEIRNGFRSPIAVPITNILAPS
jgi:hypothetical protein